MSISNDLLFGDCSGEEMVARHWDGMVEKLLEHGGKAAQRPVCDPQIGAVFDRGGLFECPQVLVRGTPNKCHANARMTVRRDLAIPFARGVHDVREGRSAVELQAIAMVRAILLTGAPQPRYTLQAQR